MWAYLHEEAGAVLPSAGLNGSAQPIEIIRQPHGLGFLPWVARVGGTTLSQEPGHQRIPLLDWIALDGRPVLGNSKTRALEFIGETDPGVILEEAKR